MGRHALKRARISAVIAEASLDGWAAKVAPLWSRGQDEGLAFGARVRERFTQSEPV
jgi:hypothetical protein